MDIFERFKTQFKIGVISFRKGFSSRGVSKTFAMFGEALIDEVYNNTSRLRVGGFYDPEQCPDDLPNKEFANFYQPVRFRPFLKLFKNLGITPRGRFVDIGSGKGKALILAAQLGFKKVRGIELFEELNVDARKNIQKFKTSNKNYQDVVFDIQTMDGGQYDLESDDYFIFLNDPFSDEVMSSFVDKIIESYKRAPREMYVVYKNNNQRHLPSFYRMKDLAEYRTFDSSGNFFEIFKFQ